MIDSDSETKQEPLEEYEQLISLAERSSESIDALEEFYEKINYRLSIYMMLATTFGTSGFLFLSGFTTRILSAPLMPASLTLLTGILSAVLFVFTVFNVMKISTHRKNLHRQLFIELDIHHDLINIIEQQKRRVIVSRTISPVKHALFEMRIRRLQRNKM